VDHLGHAYFPHVSFAVRKNKDVTVIARTRFPSLTGAWNGVRLHNSCCIRLTSSGGSVNFYIY
jgi:hypothetical protein